ncbi:hypothetical protein [Lacisediminimonas profundi]|uniref:hypothetical protein n=1 Tax=Lacisediminimonas profundi TaxID=2603856 RepID=UPI00124AFB95|nr:hypothetical protein [Lacisediminimonas profundi]
MKNASGLATGVFFSSGQSTGACPASIAFLWKRIFVLPGASDAGSLAWKRSEFTSAAVSITVPLQACAAAIACAARPGPGSRILISGLNLHQHLALPIPEPFFS